MEFYTIFIDNELYTNVIDDMNSTRSWAEGGLLWADRKKAEACAKNLKGYFKNSNIEVKELQHEGRK